MAAELLDLYMGKLEEQLDRSEDTFRNMSSLLLLLQQFPGDMEPLFQQDMVTFFNNQLPVINQLRLFFICSGLHDPSMHDCLYITLACSVQWDSMPCARGELGKPKPCNNHLLEPLEGCAAQLSYVNQLLVHEYNSWRPHQALTRHGCQLHVLQSHPDPYVHRQRNVPYPYTS